MYTIGSNGVDLTRLTRNNVLEGTPRWSPDGRRIAFWTFKSGDAAICINECQRLQRSEPDRLLRLELQPSWSPDSRRLLFQSERDGNSEIYALNVETGEQTRLTDNDFVTARPPGLQTAGKSCSTRIGTRAAETATLRYTP